MEEKKKRGGHREGAGRPPLSEEERQRRALERRQKIVKLRMTFDVESETIVERINLAAENVGVSRSEWLRDLVMNALGEMEKGQMTPPLDHNA